MNFPEKKPPRAQPSVLQRKIRFDTVHTAAVKRPYFLPVRPGTDDPDSPRNH